MIIFNVCYDFPTERFFDKLTIVERHQFSTTAYLQYSTKKHRTMSLRLQLEQELKIKRRIILFVIQDSGGHIPRCRITVDIR